MWGSFKAPNRHLPNGQVRDLNLLPFITSWLVHGARFTRFLRPSHAPSVNSRVVELSRRGWRRPDKRCRWGRGWSRDAPPILVHPH